MDKDLNLLKEFPPPSMEEWKKTVEDSLKGADFNKVMFTKTYEGITLKPIYTKADTADLPFAGSLPGAAPYLRGNEPERRLQEGWLVAQKHDTADLVTLNKELLKELLLGVTAVNIGLKHDDNERGARFATLDDLKTAFQGVDLFAAPLFMQMDMTDAGFLTLLEQYVAQQGMNLAQLPAGVGFDPTSEFARKGYHSLSLEEVWEKMCSAVCWTLDKAPNLRCISLDGSVYEAAGASSAQELAFLLSTAIGYIQGLQTKDYSIDQIARLFQVKLTLGSNFFMEIAKVRAFRLLWAEMVKAFGGSEESQKIWIHGVTASFNKSLYDSYVNVLRTTTEGFAGVIGGVDSLEIDCFNELNGTPDEASRRIARNIQVILKEEAHFGKVIDPAGGCFYVESLTAELAKEAWKIMQELESHKGMIHSLREGRIHEMIASVANARVEAVNKRRDVFVGVNMFANTLEDEPRLEIKHKTAEPVKAVVLDKGALPRLRAVQIIENLRMSIASSDASKSILLLNMGSVSDYKARADFASGFFQVGGFDVVLSPAFATAQEASDYVLKSSAGAFCICSTDDAYKHLVPEICSGLPGKTMILAGYPADMVETYKEQGIGIFIHLRADAFSTLSQLANLMGVVK